MARTYHRMYRCSENFPVELDEQWTVSEGGKVAERWRVIDKRRGSFKVEIEELIPGGI